MKKIILASTLTISIMFAFDVSSSFRSAEKVFEITAESIGKELTDIVKTKAPKNTEQAKHYCNQVSTYKLFSGIKDSNMMLQAINICEQKSNERLEEISLIKN